jgi:hypothetical protein
MGHSDLLLVSGSPPPPAAWAPPLVQFYPFPTQAAGQARRPDQCVMYLLLSVPTSAAGSIRRHACVPRSPFSPACLLVFSLSLISKPCGRCGAHGNRRNLDIHFASPIPSLRTTASSFTCALGFGMGPKPGATKLCTLFLFVHGARPAW